MPTRHLGLVVSIFFPQFYCIGVKILITYLDDNQVKYVGYQNFLNPEVGYQFNWLSKQSKTN